ncbi:MAG: HEAT repeat domain-containing protein [Gemmatales bacterium]|nr:HEAT repeat domain-containing protein [Gemmatales bacterium]MCS7161248.1 HEAT repeat domain-containing protein [Gemmatales bacterium]MDW8176451.1 HEAT repeat domain-containing protein [Gemmatales bacterium]MDW8222172.1 HEAT repeat domain-containing protein [Gemmatales bacterium]
MLQSGLVLSTLALGCLTAHLALAQGESEVAAYIKGLASPDPDVRRQSALALEKLGPQAKPAVAALRVALKDPDQFVRRFAARALGAIGPDAAAAVPDLISLLSSPQREEAEAAVSALGKIGKPAVKALSQALESTQDPLLLRTLAKTLGSLGSEAAPAVPALVQRLKNPPKVPAKADGLATRVEVLAAIVEALGNIGPAAKEAVGEIKNLLADKLLAKNKDFRAIANTAIKKISGKSP